MKPIGLVLLLGALLAFGGIFYYNMQSGAVTDCPGHWHATFGVFTPDEQGKPRLLDMGGPRAADGRAYYQLNVAPAQTVTIHMHQSGSEQGSAALGPKQMHWEGNKCSGIARALRAVDVNLADSSLEIAGQHSQADRTGSWSNEAAQRVRFHLQSWNGTAWAWSEQDVGDMLDYQPLDGEAFVVSFGDYSEEQVAAMQAAIPAPMSRANR